VALGGCEEMGDIGPITHMNTDRYPANVEGLSVVIAGVSGVAVFKTGSTLVVCPVDRKDAVSRALADNDLGAIEDAVSEVSP
jgi:hypothetical protein